MVCGVSVVGRLVVESGTDGQTTKRAKVKKRTRIPQSDNPIIRSTDPSQSDTREVGRSEEKDTGAVLEQATAQHPNTT